MEFRPCIDIHNGKVKQIVGGSLCEQNNSSNASENFISTYDAGFYARYYRDRGIKGGHIILLNKVGTDDYKATKEQALLALKEYPLGLQVGGGITTNNAKEYIDAGASHVIVTSYVFRDGIIDYDRLKALSNLVGKDHLVLDLSARKKDNSYYIVTDRWQKFTDVVLNKETLEELEKYAAEYLIHAVDVEGKQSGIDAELLDIFALYDGIPITYAGGVHTYEDLELIREKTGGKVNVTVGSALDIFGGQLVFDKVLDICKEGK